MLRHVDKQKEAAQNEQPLKNYNLDSRSIFLWS